MKIFLIRHGQSTGDIDDRYGGDYDDHLTDEGKYQAQKLAESLQTSGIEQLYYSPLLRAKETALQLQTFLQSRLEEVQELRERNKYGIITGMTRVEALKTYPELVELVKNDKNTISGAETYETFVARVLAVFERLANNQFQTIGIVTHGGPITILMRELFGKEIRKIEDCGYIEIEKQKNHMLVRSQSGVSGK